MDDVKDVGVFDRFARWAATRVSRAPFFVFCVIAVVLWAPSIMVIKNIDTWQLIINTFTTIVTFLLVALLQNSQARSDDARQFRENAIATGVRDLMDHVAHTLPCDDPSCDFASDIEALERSVGIEDHVGTKES